MVKPTLFVSILILILVSPPSLGANERDDTYIELEELQEDKPGLVATAPEQLAEQRDWRNFNGGTFLIILGITIPTAVTLILSMPNDYDSNPGTNSTINNLVNQMFKNMTQALSGTYIPEMPIFPPFVVD